MFATGINRSDFGMRHKLFLVFSSLFFITFLACQQDEETLYDEPNVQMKLYNIDSLTKVNDSLQSIGESLVVISESLTYYKDSAKVLLDSIIVLQILVNEGATEWSPVIVELETNRKIIQSFYELTEKEDSVLKAANKLWNAVAASIKNGEVLISKITNNANAKSVEYLDSADVWRVPLSNTEDEVDLTFQIGENTYNLSMTYSRSTTVDEYHNVVIQASGLAIKNHTFDSVKLYCATQECIDYESRIDIYY